MCFPGVDRVIGRKGAPLSSPPESFPLQYVSDDYDDGTKLKWSGNVVVNSASVMEG
jgi:hypothetical protein